MPTPVRLLPLLLLLCACGPTRETAVVERAPQDPQGHLNRAQRGLPVVRLWLGATELEAEVAISAREIATGMMHRTEMGENEAMLFVFAKPHRTSFYMRNTLIPLSCAYIDSKGTILEIHDMEPLDETPIVASSDRIRYVLEVNRGWFTRHGIGRGTVVATEGGTLQESFFGR